MLRHVLLKYVYVSYCVYTKTEYHISMKTTLDVDTSLLDEVRAILGTRTIKDTVEQSLRAVIRQRALERLAESAGTVDLELTGAELRKQRKQRIPRGSR